MGYYINKNSSGKPLPCVGKVNALMADGAEIVPFSDFRENMVCVVENGFFDAAAFIYSPEELSSFTRPDDYRIKTFLVYPGAKELAE